MTVHLADQAQHASWAPYLPTLLRSQLPWPHTHTGWNLCWFLHILQEGATTLGWSRCVFDEGVMLIRAARWGRKTANTHYSDLSLVLCQAPFCRGAGGATGSERRPKEPAWATIYWKRGFGKKATRKGRGVSNSAGWICWLWWSAPKRANKESMKQELRRKESLNQDLENQLRHKQFEIDGLKDQLARRDTEHRSKQTGGLTRIQKQHHWRSQHRVHRNFTLMQLPSFRMQQRKNVSVVA